MGQPTKLSALSPPRNFMKEPEPERKSPLPTPPESFRPDRLEVINRAGRHPPIELAPGVILDCLVGKLCGARNLTTGLVHFQAAAELGYHVHRVSESITVLSGQVVARVEGRAYLLGPLDNIVIPRGLTHGVINPSHSETASLHVALASHEPVRDWTSTEFGTTIMPKDSRGVAGKERVTHFQTAERIDAGPGASFIDHFNSRLMPGLEMSGGYGLFGPGGRLPAHIHDFDESICIIQGTATCVVEGRRYQMTDRATALQPRGRVHYFINESSHPMAMLWVYAGSMPERILVAEHCATVLGNPWK